MLNITKMYCQVYLGGTVHSRVARTPPGARNISRWPGMTRNLLNVAGTPIYAEIRSKAQFNIHWKTVRTKQSMLSPSFPAAPAACPCSRCSTPPSCLPDLWLHPWSMVSLIPSCHPSPASWHLAPQQFSHLGLNGIYLLKNFHKYPHFSTCFKWNLGVMGVEWGA